MNKIRLFIFFFLVTFFSIDAGYFLAMKDLSEDEEIYTDAYIKYMEEHRKFLISWRLYIDACKFFDEIDSPELKPKFTLQPPVYDITENPDYVLMQGEMELKPSKTSYFNPFETLRFLCYPFSCCFCPIPDEFNLRNHFTPYGDEPNIHDSSFGQELNDYESLKDAFSDCDDFGDLLQKVKIPIGIDVFLCEKNNENQISLSFANFYRDFRFNGFCLRNFEQLGLEDLEELAYNLWNGELVYNFDKCSVDAFLLVVSSVQHNYKVGDYTMLMFLLALNDIVYSAYTKSYVDNNALNKIQKKIKTYHSENFYIKKILYKNLIDKKNIKFDKQDKESIQELQAYQLSILCRHKVFLNLISKVIKNNIQLIDNWPIWFKVEWLNYFEDAKTACHVQPVVQQIETAILQETILSINDVMQAVIYCFKHKEYEDFEYEGFEFLKNINPDDSIDLSEDSHSIEEIELGDIFADTDIEELKNLFKICSFFLKKDSLKVIGVLRKIILNTESESVNRRSIELCHELNLEIDNSSCIANFFLSACLFHYVEYINIFIAKQVNERIISKGCEKFSYNERNSAPDSVREVLAHTLFIQKKILTLSSFFYNNSHSNSDYFHWLGAAISGELDYFRGLQENNYKNIGYLSDLYDYYNNLENVSPSDVKRCRGLQEVYFTNLNFDFRLDRLFEMFVLGPKFKPSQNFFGAKTKLEKILKEEESEQLYRFNLINLIVQEWFTIKVIA